MSLENRKPRNWPFPTYGGPPLPESAYDPLPVVEAAAPPPPPAMAEISPTRRWPESFSTAPVSKTHDVQVDHRTGITRVTRRPESYSGETSRGGITTHTLHSISNRDFS